MYISIHLDRTRYLYIYIYTSLNRYTSIHRYIHISVYGDIEIGTYVSLYIERSTIYIPGHAQAQAPTASSGSRFYGAAAPATPSASAYGQTSLCCALLIPCTCAAPACAHAGIPPYAAPCRPKGTRRRLSRRRRPKAQCSTTKHTQPHTQAQAEAHAPSCVLVCF